MLLSQSSARLESELTFWEKKASKLGRSLSPTHGVCEAKYTPSLDDRPCTKSLSIFGTKL